MRPTPNNTELREDSALVENLFSKEAIDAFEQSIQSVPSDYFENFPEQVLTNIRKNNKKAKIVKLLPFLRVAIAASVLFFAATAYLFYNNRPVENTMASISIQDVSNEEIEAYVYSNELIAEVDWQDELNKVGLDAEQPSSLLNKDSNKLNN